MSAHTLTIGIAGGSGSGKTTVTRKILNRLDLRKVIILQHDDYYRDLPDFDPTPLSEINFDHPDSLETSLLVEHLIALKEGRAVNRPVYDFSTYRRLDETKHLEPRSIIIVEGILIFAEKRLRDLMDIKIFVDTDADERLLRRLERDLMKRNRSLESVMHQYINSVKPSHLEFVEPSKRWADVIIPRGGENTVAIDIVVSKIQGMLQAID